MVELTEDELIITMRGLEALAVRRPSWWHDLLDEEQDAMYDAVEAHMEMFKPTEPLRMFEPLEKEPPPWEVELRSRPQLPDFAANISMCDLTQFYEGAEGSPIPLPPTVYLQLSETQRDTLRAALKARMGITKPFPLPDFTTYLTDDQLIHLIRYCMREFEDDTAYSKLWDAWELTGAEPVD